MSECIELNIEWKNEEDLQQDIFVAELSALGFFCFEEDKTHLRAYIYPKDFDESRLEECFYLKNVFDKIKIKTIFHKSENWNAEWEKNYKPIVISENVYIRAPFHSPPSQGLLDIIIAPKMAFGTGHHATTSGMIELLMEVDIKGKKVLDVGCGTGILAIVSAKRGAATVTAIDNDPEAVENTIANALENNVEIDALLRENFKLKEDFYEIILANITRDVLLVDMKWYTDLLSENGYLFLSGFLIEQHQQVKRKAIENNLIELKYIKKHQWVTALYKLT